MIRTLTALIACAIIGFGAVPASAQSVAPGTSLSGTLMQDVSSKDAQVGQGVTLTNVTAANGSTSVRGATIYGHVADVTRAGQGKRPQVQIALDKIVYANGQTQAITGVVTSAQENTKSNTVREVGGAVLGNIVGNIAAKKLGLPLGGLLGAAGGFLYAKNYHENVTIPKDSIVTVRVTTARRQAKR
ncbi:MAG: hypothetical protein NVS2B17_01950 [Candidatus Velthaea sp.]